MLVVRSISPDEWRLWKRLRLHALADSPDAFGETLGQARERSDAEWMEMAASAALPDRNFFIAERDDGPVGMAIVRVFEDASANDPARAHVFAMWVAPTARGMGAGRKLLDAAVEWARNQPVEQVVLQVTEGNESARRLYESAGFVDTGRREPLRPGSDVMTAVMALRL